MGANDAAEMLEVAKAENARLERELTAMITERDEWYERLSKLIYSLATVEQIGEWSNANDPVAEFEQLIHDERKDRRTIEALALLDAAQAWSWSGWADTPRKADRIADRMAASQYAGDWLRARATALMGERSDSESPTVGDPE